MWDILRKWFGVGGGEGVELCDIFCFVWRKLFGVCGGEGVEDMELCDMLCNVCIVWDLFEKLYNVLVVFRFLFVFLE